MVLNITSISLPPSKDFGHRLLTCPMQSDRERGAGTCREPLEEASRIVENPVEEYQDMVEQVRKVLFLVKNISVKKSTSVMQ